MWRSLAWLLIFAASCRARFDVRVDATNADDGITADAKTASSCGVDVGTRLSVGSSADVTTLTIPQVAGGANTVLLVAAALPSDSATWQTATYGGMPMTLVTSLVWPTRTTMSVWALPTPGAGPRDVVLTATAPRAATALALSITDAAPTSPIGSESHVGGSGATSSIDVAATTADLVVDFLAQGSDPIGREFDATDVATPGPGQSETARAQDMAPSRNVRIVASIKAADATTAMSWALTGGYDHVQIGVPVHAAACP